MRPSRVTKKRLKVGIVGCGSIGGLLARACEKGLKDKVTIAGICDMDRERASSLKRKLGTGAPVLSLERLIKRSDLVVEAASAGASAEIAKKAISCGKDIMVMSTGGLLGKAGLFREAARKGCRVYIPSGAICGLDGVKAAAMGRIRSVTLTTRKPSRGLEGAPYIKRRKIDLKAIKKEKLIFKGSANEAVKAFPKNINVSAVLSLAGIGARKTRVRIIVSPKSSRNVHEIELEGDFGRAHMRCENVPSRDNPKTSMLASLSAIATLRGIVESVRIGT